ncbi:MAG: hypothetical protein KDC79_00875 [Cyclobacteriaceae bacterium]|nr:hypothetical protein [Cyclobacteriaceae bacterium]
MKTLKIGIAAVLLFIFVTALTSFKHEQKYSNLKGGESVVEVPIIND